MSFFASFFQRRLKKLTDILGEILSVNMSYKFCSTKIRTIERVKKNR